MTDVEINFGDLFGEIFNNPPKNKKEIVISFDTRNLEELYERLLELFVEGLKIKFGDIYQKVNLSSLTLEDFNLMNRYMNSFGVDAHYELFTKQEFIEKYPIFIDYKNTISVNLIDYKYYFFVDGKIYVFFFSLM